MNDGELPAVQRIPVGDADVVLLSRPGPDEPIVVHPVGCILIDSLLRNGWSKAVVCQRLGGITLRELEAAAERQPEVARAMATGLGAMEKDLVSALLATAKKGNVQAAMFLLKSRFGYRDAGADRAAPAVAVQIVMPAAMTPEQYAAALAAKERDQ